MADNSGIASFQFVSYKIDKTILKAAPNINTLMLPVFPSTAQIEISFGIRKVGKYFFSEKIHYIGGVDVTLKIFDKDKHLFLNGEFGIAGLFQSSGKIEEQQEKNIALYNIPAILLPYLRSAITTVISQSGFGTFVLPLFNIYEIAKKNPVEIIDYTKSTPETPKTGD
ncbi:hypothetical protein FACS189450_06020 [Spirochaetia bacterium]|nr:hypothetical protein FACS189450_06020 [Spirochaetia bacterium]